MICRSHYLTYTYLSNKILYEDQICCLSLSADCSKNPSFTWKVSPCSVVQYGANGLSWIYVLISWPCAQCEDFQKYCFLHTPGYFR